MSKEQILVQLQTNKISVDEASKLLAELESKNGAAGRLSFKVSEKGGVSVYGLQARFPVTLYGEQWERLIAQIDELKAYMVANKSKLSTKADKKAAA